MDGGSYINYRSGILYAYLFENKISTMPQFLSQRYNKTVSLIMAIFWLLLYIMVNLTSILYLGALAVSGISGLEFLYLYDFLSGFCYHHYHRWHESYWLY